ncbi:shikimate kinase [Desulfosarcina alkanivorans]|uniref:Shikimate kinase n=1 Tax=Desulfosarcina alkanivorans TaxID=571177 RepID=A0A5K7YMI5_9BACT|nr:shikimate kinase AroL [Desulfosarcina alkanivorans]BBO69595.1 shikimate kinase [Desulfosarcina alkanivorans]
MILYLIGYRCTGKTTVGRALARRLGWPFTDTDQMIAATAGNSIARIVDRHGWPYFRQKERQALASVSEMDHQVVATGGGIVLDDRNVAIMKTSGRVTWLKAGRKTIEMRMLADDATAGNRPSLTGQGLMEEIESVLSERRPLYEKAADLALATDHEKIETLCDRIVAEFKISELRD